jgi:hypothetical protein
MPRHAVRAIGAFGALYARLNPHGAAGFDASILTGMQEKRFRSGARARDELGLPWTPIASSIETAWHWFVEHGYASVRPWNRLMRRFA